MASTKPHESKPVSRTGTLSEHTSDWISLFIKHFELNLLDASHDLPPDASEPDYASAAIRAMIEMVLEFGVDGEVVAETVGQVLIEERQGPMEWTSDLETRRLILQLDLNSPRLKMWRSMWMRIVDLAEKGDADLYYQLVGFPRDLPDLSKLKPPHNRRKAGIEECWFARRRRAELPSVY